jgi:hypothetical protein
MKFNKIFVLKINLSRDLDLNKLENLLREFEIEALFLKADYETNLNYYIKYIIERGLMNVKRLVLVEPRDSVYINGMGRKMFSELELHVMKKKLDITIENIPTLDSVDVSLSDRSTGKSHHINTITISGCPVTLVHTSARIYVDNIYINQNNNIPTYIHSNILCHLECKNEFQHIKYLSACGK